MKKLLKIKEVADLLGVSTQTLRLWEKKGELVSYRNPINNYRMYKVSQIETFLEEMRVNRSRRGRFRLRVRIVEDDD